MTILCIETSTTACSAAITIDGNVVANKSNLQGANHASELPLFVDDLLSESKVNDWKLDAIALSQGPGSYTGLRIGTSIAKGMCYALQIPLIPIDTLQIMCKMVKSIEEITENTLLRPLLDARRMEVYTAAYKSVTLERLGDVEAHIIGQSSFLEELERQPIIFFGNGAEKCKSVIVHENACFVDEVIPQAQYMGLLAEKSTNNLNCKQLAYYEPFYLKDFVPAPSHIKGLK